MPFEPPAFSVLYFNQSSRVYDKTVDASYLLGINPTNGQPTNSLLGPFLAGKNYSVISDAASSVSGSVVNWSVLYIRSVNSCALVCLSLTLFVSL